MRSTSLAAANFNDFLGAPPVRHRMHHLDRPFWNAAPEPTHFSTRFFLQLCVKTLQFIEPQTLYRLDHVHQRDAGRRQLRGQLQRLLRAVRQVGRNQHMVKARSRCRGRFRFHTHNSSAQHLARIIPSPLVPLGCGIGPPPDGRYGQQDSGRLYWPQWSSGEMLGGCQILQDCRALRFGQQPPPPDLRLCQAEPRHLAELGVDLSAQLLDEWNASATIVAMSFALELLTRTRRTSRT